MRLPARLRTFRSAGRCGSPWRGGLRCGGRGRGGLPGFERGSAAGAGRGASGWWRRPRPERIAELEAEIADCDEARRVELMAEIDALKAKARRIPFIDPIDIRYRRFETLPKPMAQ